MSGPPSRTKRRGTKIIKGLMFAVFATSAVGMLLGGVHLGGGAPAPKRVAKPPYELIPDGGVQESPEAAAPEAAAPEAAAPEAAAQP